MMGGDLWEAADLPFSGNRVTFVYTEPDSAYSVVEWVAAPGAPGTPLHLHRATDEAFYVLEGTLGFQVGQRTLELRACLVRVRVKPFWRSLAYAEDLSLIALFGRNAPKTNTNSE